MKPCLFILAATIVFAGITTTSFAKATPPAYEAAAHTDSVTYSDETVAKTQCCCRLPLLLVKLLHIKPQQSRLAYTDELRPIELYYFPGTSHKNALVIGAVHGAELSSIEVAKQLIKNLSAGEKSYYNVVVVPSLFPDNAAMADSFKTEIGSINNIGRYTSNTTADPNRQMPAAGSAFAAMTSYDFAGREIEPAKAFFLG